MGSVLGLPPAILQVHVHRGEGARGHQAGKEGSAGRQVCRDWSPVDGRGTDARTAREKLGRTNWLHLNSKVSARDLRGMYVSCSARVLVHVQCILCTLDVCQGDFIVHALDIIYVHYRIQTHVCIHGQVHRIV